MTRGLLELPLRGREREMEAIRRTLDTSLTDGFALLSVEGGPGSGKTRLLRSAVALAAELGFVTVTGSDEQHHRLATVRPLQPPVDTSHPVLFAIDDIHMLTAQTAEALLARAAGVPTVWLTTRRTGGASVAMDMLPKPASMAERILLGPLSACAIRETVVDVLGRPPSPALAQLVDTAAGNPMLVIELLEGMCAEQTIRLHDQDAQLVVDRIPAQLHTLVRGVLKDYSEQCRKLLRVAAVLGRELDFGQLSAMLGVSLPELLPMLEEACDSGVVSCDDRGVSFCNELLWRVVVDSVPPALRMELLRQADSGEPDWEPEIVVPEPAGERPDGLGRDRFLNSQERTIIDLVGAGLTNRQIAHRVSLSPHTVNYHLKKIFRMFGVSSRIELLRAIVGQEEAGSLAQRRA